MRWRWIVIGALLVIAVAIVLKLTHYWPVVANVFEGKKSVEKRVAQYGPGARERWRPDFEKAGLKYPPASVALVGIKDAKRLEVYAKNPQRGWQFVTAYRILAASGQL